MSRAWSPVWSVGEQRNARPQQAQPGDEGEAFATSWSRRASWWSTRLRAVWLWPSAPSASYIEAGGDPVHLANVPISLQAVRGGLWFLGQERAAKLIGLCADYIQTQMLDARQMPSEQMLETWPTPSAAWSTTSKVARCCVPRPRRACLIWPRKRAHWACR